jgi:hypothetical protein
MKAPAAMSYLERYLSGEHEQVWAELVAQGKAVRAEPLYSDAVAVARETMRRVRWNIETLIPRLRKIGYEFGYGWLDVRDRSFALNQPAAFSPPSAETRQLIIELERVAGPLPLSLQAFYAVVGSVNFVGTAPTGWRIDENADPLYVYPIEDAVAEYTDWNVAHQELAAADKAGNPGPFRVPIAPDYLHKYNISGGRWYNIALPNPAIDAELDAERHATTFVNYLRICFRWGGFPGWERIETRPDRDLIYLTEGLQPI